MLHSAVVTDAPDTGILEGVQERFAASTDFTVGLEEEYQLLDPATLALVNRYEEMTATASPQLAERLAGELIASEIEYRTVKHDTFATAALELVRGRLAVIDLAERLGIAVAVAGTHPFSRWEDQRLIDTPHYRLLDESLGYVAWTNNTWSIHLHCGVRDADRAMAVCTAMRSVLPDLLALSANSPVFWGRATRLHSTRTQVFVRSFPRCGIPDALPTWRDYAEFVDLLQRTGSIQKATQIWWSVRPHHSYGTIEVRICDGQTEMADALAIMALAYGCLARFCAAYDDGETLPADPDRLLEENLWRAIRHGLTGDLIDLTRGRTRPATRAIEELLEWVEPVVEPLGIARCLAGVEAMLAGGNGAMRQLAALERTGDVRALQAVVVERTRASASEMLSSLNEEVAA